MMKFFRKHNKKLLAVFMVLLMVVFVGGSALTYIATPSLDRKVANSKYGPITELDIAIAKQTTTLLTNSGYVFDWKQPMVNLRQGAPVTNTPLTLKDWVLLVREAEALGLRPSWRSLEARMVGPDTRLNIDRAAYAFRVKPSRVFQALAELEAVRSVARRVGAASTPSEAEVRTAARNALETVKLNAVLLPARAFVDFGRPIDESELEEHLAPLAGTERGQGLEFGYHRPDSVRIQYIKVDLESLADQLTIANLQRKARTYYDENHTTDRDFRRIMTTFRGADFTEEVGPQPSEFLSWAEAEELALRRVRRAEAGEVAKRIASQLLRYDGELWADAIRGKEDGYKETPDKCATLEHFQHIVSSLPNKLTYSGVVTVGTTDFFNAGEADSIPGLEGVRYAPKGQPARYLTTLPFLTQALVPVVPAGEGVTTSDYLAPFQTSQYPLIDSEGNVYLFRVVDARPAHRADALDDVRDQVIEDVLLQEGYDEAKIIGEQLRINALSQGLEVAFDEDEGLTAMTDEGDDEVENAILRDAQLGYYTPPAFARARRFQAGAGRPPGGMWVNNDVGSLPNEVIDQCFALEDAEDKVAVIEIPARALILVAEWVATYKGREDEFTDFRKLLVGDMESQRYRAAIRDWLEPDKIQARCSFARVTDEDS